MKSVHEISRTPFDYKIDLVGDDTYGKSYPNKGCWDGMIGELMDTHGCPNGGTRKVNTYNNHSIFVVVSD